MRKLLYIALGVLLMGCAHKEVSLENAKATEKETVEKPRLVGAYTEGRSVSKDELALFNATYKGEVALTPISVSTQVVAGTNYKFICKDKQGARYKVVIYEKLPCYGGEAEVTSVEKL